MGRLENRPLEHRRDVAPLARTTSSRETKPYAFVSIVLYFSATAKNISITQNRALAPIHPREPHKKSVKKEISENALHQPRAPARTSFDRYQTTLARKCERASCSRYKKSYYYFGALTFMMFQSLYVFAKCMKHNKFELFFSFRATFFRVSCLRSTKNFWFCLGKKFEKIRKNKRARDARRHATSFFHGGGRHRRAAASRERYQRQRSSTTSR